MKNLENTKLERQLPNGNWFEIEISRKNYFLEKLNSEEMASLEAGQTVRYDSDWYAKIRIATTNVVAKKEISKNCYPNLEGLSNSEIRNLGYEPDML